MILIQYLHIGNVYEVYMLCMDKAEIVGEISIQFKL